MYGNTLQGRIPPIIAHLWSQNTECANERLLQGISGKRTMPQRTVDRIAEYLVGFTLQWNVKISGS